MLQAARPSGVLKVGHKRYANTFCFYTSQHLYKEPKEHRTQRLLCCIVLIEAGLTSVPCKPVYAADILYFFTGTRRVRPSISCIGMQTLFQEQKRKVCAFQGS